MDMATVSANGQITLPKAVRSRLGAGPGDQVAFVENEYGVMVVLRPKAMALLEAQRAFRSAAGEAGLTSEDDINRLVTDMCAERARSGK